MKKTAFLILILFSLMPLMAQPAMLSTLKSEHPRLLLDRQRMQEIKSMSVEDTLLAEVIRIIHNYADSALLEPVIKYEFDQEGENNPRLKAQRRAAMFRVYNCGFTYLLTGDTIYAHRAKQDLLGAAAFPDWAPWHFLNVGEISAFMGIGYDWLYDYLTGEEKHVIERAIIRHGLIPGIKAYNGEAGVERWWVDQMHNINQVCSGGMALASLAIAEASPDTVTMILQGALSSVPNAMLGYLPDGAWREGPTYWAYGTTYNGLFMSALRTAMDTVFQMDQGPGYAALGKSGAYHIHTAGPTNLYFNFGDSKRTLYYSPVLFWLAGEYNEPGYAWFERNIIVNDLPRMRKGGLMDDDTLDRFLALLAVWYSRAGQYVTNDDFPLDATFGGVDVALGAFHSEWSREAIYFGFKGGKAHASHSQMDIGSFVMDAKGERWAWDLGYGNNKQPGFSDYNDERWSFFINTNLAHNTLSFWGMLQNKDAFVPVREFYSDPDWAYASIDMTEVYRGIVNSCVRKYWFPERSSIEIIDDIDPAVGYMDVRWAMVTTAELSLHGNEALLKQNGKTCKVTILEPEGALFEELSTRPPDPGPEETLNEGTTMLAAHIYQEETLPFTIKVSITPYDTTLSGGTTAIWQTAEKEQPVLTGIFPNPVADQANVIFDLPEEGRITLSLCTLNGQLVTRLAEGTRPAGRNVIRCRLGACPPGVYMLQLIHEHGTESRKLIRQ